MKELLRFLTITFKQNVRLYFSPFVGAVRGFQAECRRIEAENAALFGRSDTVRRSRERTG
jgi:hypothetical protein